MTPRARLLIVVAVAGTLLVVVLIAVLVTRTTGTPAFRGTTPPTRITLPAFALHDWDGQIVRSDDLTGKVVLVTFLDTQCRESCPLIAAQIGQALAQLDTHEREQVVALALTTDPAEDTADAIRAFLQRHHVLGRLHYLTGTVAELRPVWTDFQILPSLDTGRDDLHSAPVRIYDRTGVWVATQHPGADLTPDNLVHDLRLALTSH